MDTDDPAMATGPATDPALREVLDELREREPIFHRRELGTSRADFEAQTAPDFWEVGASGRRYDREECWSHLAVRHADPDDALNDRWTADGFACQAAGPDTYLLTYTLRQGARGERVTRRLTVWQRTRDGWRALYHQGTMVSGPTA